MIKKKKNVLGVILARSGSKGIKNKNIKELCGHPLISYSIYAGLSSKFISKLIVSTDSKKIAKISEAYGANVPFLRKKTLSRDKVPSKDALKDAVINAEKIYKQKFDYVIEIPAVAPLRTKVDIDKALKILFLNRFDSVISFTRVFDKHPLRMKKINSKGLIDHYDPKKPENEISRRQDFSKCFIRNGAIYSMKRETILKKNSRMGNKIKPYIMNEIKSVNIDQITDFYTCEKLIEKGLCQNFPSIIFNNSGNQKPKIIVKNKNFDFLLAGYPKNIFDMSDKDSFLRNINEIHCDISQFNLINDKLKKKIIAILVPTNGLKKLNLKILHRFKNLKYIITPSTGLTHVDAKYTKESKIKTINLENIEDTKNIKASSEFCLLMVLASLKNYKESLEIVKSGNWRNFEKRVRSREINGLSFGFLGLGRIGKNVSKTIFNLGGKISYYDPHVNYKKKFFKKEKNLKKFFSKLDFLIISARLNNQTKSIINSSSIKFLKKGAKIINISRGELVDEKTILRNLRKKKIGSYYTDVVSNEETILKNKNILVKSSKNFTNISITPHIGGLTYESEIKAINRILYKFKSEYNKIFN